MASNATDPLAALKAKLDALNTDFRPIPQEIMARFADVPEVLPHLFRNVERDFKDDKYLTEEGFYIFKEGLDHVAAQGRWIMPMLTNGFNTKGAIGLLMLAYNLRVPKSDGTKYAFDDIPAEIGVMDVHGDTVVSTQYLGRPSLNAYGASHNVAGEAMFYCYIAASTLRLFIKSPENYINAWTNIVNRFEGFYGFPPPLLMMAPTLEAIRGLHSAFQSDRRFKMTLNKILYYSIQDTRVDGLKRFLYDIHLENVGLHAFGIFMQLCASLNVDSSTLLQVLQNQEFARQTDALRDMIRMLVNNSQEYSRKMWRFGRVFSHDFMSPLHTKACPKFVYILACMLNSLDPGKCEDILQIVLRDQVSADMKRRCAAVAQCALSKIRASTAHNPI